MFLNLIAMLIKKFLIFVIFISCYYVIPYSILPQQDPIFKKVDFKKMRQ